MASRIKPSINIRKKIFKRRWNIKRQLMLIDGEWVEASDGGLNNVINPATEEVFAQVARAREEDVVGDAMIQTTGMGLVKPGILGITIGTAGIVAMGLDRFHPNADGRLQIFCNNSPGTWHVMGVTLAAGGSYRWSRDALCEVEKEKEIIFHTTQEETDELC